MTQIKLKLLLVSIFIVTSSGCAMFSESKIEYDAKAGLAVTSNTSRNFVVDYGNGETDPIKRCLEAPGPATALNDFKLNTEVSGDAGKVTNGKVKVDIGNTESLAKLYEVSSILQFAHAMSYRLCEATINGYIPEKEYSAKFDEIISATTKLLEAQLKISQEETKQLESKVKLLSK